MRLADELALVTGSTSGIGRAIALRFAAEGAHVVVHGRDEARGDAAVREIRDHGGHAVFIAADLADEAACADLVEAPVERADRTDRDGVRRDAGSAHPSTAARAALLPPSSGRLMPVTNSLSWLAR